MLAPALLTVPPFAIVRTAVPELPMLRPTLLVQLEPGPLTAAVPCEPVELPMLAVNPATLLSVPPFAIVSAPVPKLPMLRPGAGALFDQVEPVPVIVTAPSEPTVKPTETPPALVTFRRSEA